MERIALIAAGLLFAWLKPWSGIAGLVLAVAAVAIHLARTRPRSA
jgi:hypothetical protein